jgi:predicted transglutaminase-like cysteine proteinase
LKEYNNENRLVLIINTFKKDFVLDGLNKGIEIYKNSDKISEWQHPEINMIIEKL